MYTLEVTWSDGSKSQTHVNSSSLADWKVGHRLVSLLKAIAHRRYDATGRDETSDDRVDCEAQLGGGKCPGKLSEVKCMGECPWANCSVEEMLGIPVKISGFPCRITNLYVKRLGLRFVPLWLTHKHTQRDSF